MKDAPVRFVALVLDSVKVIVDVSPDGMDVGLNALAIVGLARTVRSTDEETGPGRVCVVSTPLVTLGFTPTVVEVTVTVTVQVLSEGMVIPEKFRSVSPIVKLLELAPVQVPPAF